MTCPHQRPDWRMCPHCAGLAEAQALNYSVPPTECRRDHRPEVLASYTSGSSDEG